jgi:hypothetical protein
MTDVCVIVDESGSMAYRKEQTIEAVNQYFTGLRDDQSVENVYLYMFHSGPGVNVTTVYDGENINAVTPFGKDYYDPRGGTPLFDAMGRILTDLTGARMFVVVLTDGQENASSEYSRESVRSMIEEKEAAGWDFIFLGAEFDAWTGNARDLGITHGKTLSYSGANTQAAWDAARSATAQYSTTGTRLADDHFTNEDYHEGYFDS